MRLALGVLIIGLAAATVAGADVIFVCTEEQLDGREAGLPLPGLEGILEALFETSHVAIEPGSERPETDWEREDFRQAAALARQAGADALLVARFTVNHSSATGRLASRAAFRLLDPAGPRVVAREELFLDGGDRPEADSRRLCFELGMRVAERAARLWPAPPGGE